MSKRQNRVANDEKRSLTVAAKREVCDILAAANRDDTIPCPIWRRARVDQGSGLQIRDSWVRIPSPPVPAKFPADSGFESHNAPNCYYKYVKIILAQQSSD